MNNAPPIGKIRSTTAKIIWNTIAIQKYGRDSIVIEEYVDTLSKVEPLLQPEYNPIYVPNIAEINIAGRTKRKVYGREMAINDQTVDG